jgi:hypothetical protein
MNRRYDPGTVTVVGDGVERLHEVAPHAVGAGRDAAQELAGRPRDALVHPHRPLHLLLLAVPLGRRRRRGPGGRGHGNDCPAMRGGEAGPQRWDGQDGGGREVPGQGGGGRRRREGRRGSCHFYGPSEAESGRTSPCEAGERTRYSLAEIFLLPPRLLGSAGLVVVWRP